MYRFVTLFEHFFFIGSLKLTFLHSIGGIGLFLVYTGVEVTSGIETASTHLSYYREIFQLQAFRLWGTSLAVAVFLKLLQKRITHPLFVPIFYVCVPAVFYFIVLISGVSIETLRKERWLFEVPGGKQAPFWTFWTYFKFSEVQWSAIPGGFSEVRVVGLNYG